MGISATNEIRVTHTMNIEMEEFGQRQHHRMANTTPVEMIDITTGKEMGPYMPASNQPQVLPDTTEIIVFKTNKTLPETCGVTSCTKDSCSCDREAVGELIDEFCEGLRLIVKSRSKMCPHTVANELMGEIQNVFFTWWENDGNGQAEHTNSNSSERNQPNSSPRISYESPPTSKASSSDGPTSALDSATPAQEQDPQLQVLWLNKSIYLEQPSDDDADPNEGTGQGMISPTSLPEISTQTGATESESHMNEPDGKSKPTSSRAVTSSLELDSPNPSSNTIPDAIMGRRPSTIEKEVPELEGDAGIFCSNNNASIAFTERLSTMTGFSITEEVTGSQVSSQSDMIIDEEGLPTHSSVENQDSLCGHFPDLSGSNNIATEQSTSTTGVDISQNSSTCSKSQGVAKVPERINRVQEEHMTDGTGERNITKTTTGDGKVRPRSGYAAPASVKDKRAMRDNRRFAKDFAKIILSQQQSSGSESGSPLKRRRQEDNVEVASISSSPEITLLAKKKPRVIVSDDEYDTDQGTAAKSVGMEVEDNEPGSEKEAINQEQNTVDDSASVTTEEVHDADEHNQIVDYGCSSPETVASLDNVPLSDRLKMGKRASLVEQMSVENMNEKNSTNRLSNTNQKKSRDLVAQKSADEVFQELQGEKRKENASRSLFNISGSSGDDDVLFVEEYPPSKGKKDKRNLTSKTKPANNNPVEPESIRIKFPPSDSVNTPTESQVDSRSNQDEPKEPSNTERVPLLRSVSAPAGPATAETSKRISSLENSMVEKRSRGELHGTTNIEPSADVVPEIPGLETDFTATIQTTMAKPTRQPPPPPVISKSSTMRKDVERNIREGQMSIGSKTTPSQATLTNSSSSSITNKSQQQQSVSGNINSTNTENCTSPLRAPPARRPIIFDPRSEAMQIRQKPVPKVTKDKAESLLNKKSPPLPIPNPLPKKQNTSATSANPQTSGIPTLTNVTKPKIQIEEYLNRNKQFGNNAAKNMPERREVVPGRPDLFNKGPQLNIPPTAQQSPALSQTKSKFSFEAGEIRMAPKQPTATDKPGSTIPGSRDRNLGDSSPRDNPLESRNAVGLDRGSESSRTRRFSESYENSFGQSSSKLNENASSSSKSTMSNDPRLRNRSSVDENNDVLRSSKSNESELSDPRLRKNPITSPDNENISGRRSPNESELRDPRLRHSSSSSTENHANRDGRSPNPMDDENEVHDPRLRNRHPPPPPAWNAASRNSNSNSNSSGRGTWKRADGKFVADQRRSGADGHPHASNDKMSSQSPHDQGQRSSQLGVDFDGEANIEPGRQWERGRENSSERRHSRERYYSGERNRDDEGDMERRIPTQQYRDRDDRGRGQFRGRGGRRGQYRGEGGYRGGHHQDFRQHPHHRNNEQDRGGSRGGRGLGTHIEFMPSPGYGYQPQYDEYHQEQGPPPLVDMQFQFSDGYQETYYEVVSYHNFPPLYGEFHPQGPPFYY